MCALCTHSKSGTGTGNFSFGKNYSNALWCGVVLNRLIKSHYDFSSHSFRPFHLVCLRLINIFIYFPFTSNFHSTGSYFALLYNLWLTSTRVFLPQIKSIGQCTMYIVHRVWMHICMYLDMFHMGRVDSLTPNFQPRKNSTLSKPKQKRFSWYEWMRFLPNAKSPLLTWVLFLFNVLSVGTLAISWYNNNLPADSMKWPFTVYLCVCLCVCV